MEEITAGVIVVGVTNCHNNLEEKEHLHVKTTVAIFHLIPRTIKIPKMSQVDSLDGS